MARVMDAREFLRRADVIAKFICHSVVYLFSVINHFVANNLPCGTYIMVQTHVQDGKWAWIVCVSATLSWLAAMGFVFSFGIFFPVFMDHFQETREKTGKETDL